MGISLLSLLIVSIVVIASTGFCALSVMRLYAYIQAYRFERSQYTLLFGVIPMRAVVWLYALSSLAAAGLFIAVYFYITL